MGTENSSVMAQEAGQASTSATYNFGSIDPDALEYHVEGAVDSVLKLIEETVEGPLTSNTTERPIYIYRFILMHCRI